jgi:hypothetical protein
MLLGAAVHCRRGVLRGVGRFNEKKKDSHTKVRRLPQDPQVINRLVYIVTFLFGNTPAMALAANVTLLICRKYCTVIQI